MTKELEFLLKIISEAKQILKNSKNAKQKLGSSDNDLITDNDIKIEKFLISKIKEKYPKFDIVSEEFNYNNKVTKNAFVIDPIDGTINYANGLPLYAIQVACIKNGKTIASVLDMSEIGLCFYADCNGAFLNGKQIYVNEVPIKNALYDIEGSSVLPQINNMMKHSKGFRKFGGVCNAMAFVAAGWIHGGVFCSDKIWDYLPGMYIAQMAGAVVADEPGFHAVAMNKEFLEILRAETAKKKNKSNIIVLHSLNGDTLKMWGGDLQNYFITKDINVLLPEFPIRENSSYEKFDKILSAFLEHGSLNENTIVVAHSIGNPYFIRFCKKHKYMPKAYVAVAPGAIYNYPSTRNDYIVKVKEQAYLKPEELAYAKKIKNLVCIYSDEDDKNTEKFTRFIKDTGANGMYLKGYNHFDGYHRIYKVPELIDILNELLK